MPARKPSSLHTRHATAAEKAERNQQESAVRPERPLPMEAPTRLKGHDVAAAAWRRLMRIYAELEGEIVTRLDQDLLIDYCMLLEQLHEIDKMRKTVQQAWDQLEARRLALIEEGEHEAATKLIDKVLEACDMVVKLDSRADRKRSLLHQIRQSLYLTPRARAGVAPNKKEVEPEKDPLERLLDNVEDFVNGGK
jgi:phage terminase small subunit